MNLPTAIAGAEIGGPQLIQRIRDFIDDSLEGRIPGTPGGTRTTATIAAEFKRFGLRPGGDHGTYLQRVTDSLTPASDNVVGVLEGALPADSGYVLIYTHWDNVRGADGKSVPGAVDNAAGLATLEEVAGAFTRMATRPKHAVVFLAATGGETGGSGIAWYANHAPIPLERATAAIEIEGFNQWGRTHDLGVWPGSDSTLVALLGEALAFETRVVGRSSSNAQWCAPASALTSRGVPFLRTSPGTRYLGRDSSFAADREREFAMHDRHRATDVIKPDWDFSGAAEDAQVLFRAAFFMAERLKPRVARVSP